MAARLTWLGRAADKIQGDLIRPLSRELRAVFPHAGGITVYDCFGGFSQNQRRKVVLGVEVRSRRSYHTHVVKLGERKAVAADYEGWRRCMLRHNFASRIFVSLEKRDLPRGRVAVIYQDAFRLFDSVEDAQGVQMLETVTLWAIKDDKPDPLSVERVIRQLFTELHRWFYRSPRADAAVALRYYRRRLRRALDKWATQPWRGDLRRDLIWLLCSRDLPDQTQPIAYLDPYDYVGWALRERRIPQTLIGRSHGDLHGRNILVGVQRGEVEYPAVFDYGEMSDRNVLAWDFVKLECEIKVRLLLSLYRDEAAREALFKLESEDPALRFVTARTPRPAAQADPRSLRAEQLAFAARFEATLAALTARLHRLAEPANSDPPGGRNITGHRSIDRALAILLRIRQEAALFLGDRQPQRGQRGLWRDEYYFALAVYGLCTAKFDYKETESAFALVSAGVAAAQIEAARGQMAVQIAAKRPGRPAGGRAARCPYPSYRVPLARAHRVWKAKSGQAELAAAIRAAADAARHYPHAVPLLQEYVLLLAEAGRYEDALQVLAPLEEVCTVFRDEQTLCRIGRLCKQMGDRALADNPVPVAALSRHAARQWYEAALRRYREAFAISRFYYPGVNAATLALMIGRHEESRELAAEVLAACRRLDLSTLPMEECFWVLVTEGEAKLLLHKGREAAATYHEALAVLSPSHRGMAQSAYNQVCRLAWALGGVVAPVAAAFRRSPFRLAAGPLGGCCAFWRRQTKQGRLTLMDGAVANRPCARPGRT